MVTIGVIAVLIGILTPALRGAIRASRDVRCLANQRQIAVGWISYTNDHKKFPSGEPEYIPQQDHTGAVVKNADGSDAMLLHGPSVELMRDWGGVDWFIENPFAFDSQSRPLNNYIGNDTQVLKSRAEIFRCPNDNGLLVDTGSVSFGGVGGLGVIDSIQYQWGGSNLPGSEGLDLISKSAAEDAGENVFSIWGTSYRANDWIWAPVGNPRGFHRNGRDFQATTGSNRPHDVAEPSGFILTGDWGTLVVGRLRKDRRIGFDFGWWHGEDVCNMAYFDGSARRTHMTPGVAATNEYTFYLDRRLQPKSSALLAF